MYEFLLALPILLFSMVAHEYAHGYAALRQGDSTALALGRLTMNPLRHIDPWFTILLPVVMFVGSGGRVIFGGAKPVPVNPQNYRHLRRGDIIVSAAGVAVNAVLTVVCLVAVVVLGLVSTALGAKQGLPAVLQRMLAWGVWLNLLLAWFNLIPVPPLDGSHILYRLLPARLAEPYRHLGRYGVAVLFLVVLVMPGALSVLLVPAYAAQDVACRLMAPYSLLSFPMCQP